MTIYYVDWSLATGGEFYVRADNDAEAQAIIRDVINGELDRQMLDAREDADITYSNDDESEGAIDGPLYARDAEGRTIKAEHRR